MKIKKIVHRSVLWVTRNITSCSGELKINFSSALDDPFEIVFVFGQFWAINLFPSAVVKIIPRVCSFTFAIFNGDLSIVGVAFRYAGARGMQQKKKEKKKKKKKKREREAPRCTREQTGHCDLGPRFAARGPGKYLPSTSRCAANTSSKSAQLII
ncbi:hypothetical protein PUN28_019871 [Cardiocondyla obscurior]|uniref:Uncharacterized protein n=1 Tax=Cardiocondyla obscurior TaxID=286306 RepID=A0AAW2ED99_9HYME